jgi:poly [ADP-ribose] polymerase 10/14/15
MYLVRALTGVFTRGDRSMIVPPYKDSVNFKEYDSVVDNPSNPSIFVIFSDELVYPEYLITFKM